MKYEIKGLIGKHEVVRSFPNFETASKEFNRLKKKGLSVILLADGKDVSSTVVKTEKEKENAQSPASQPVKAKSAEKVVFAWKEGEKKGQINVDADRAQLLLARAERAGYQACIFDKSKQLIAKVNC